MENKLTATIITFNEAQNIARCIASLQPVADEIIVLDSFSTDQTVAICKAQNVSVFQREWEGYATAKNHLNSLASHEYIFSIDADESLDEELQKAILVEKQKGFRGIYSVNRFTNYCGDWIRYSGWYPDIKTRIFPHSKSKWTGEFVHEELEVEGSPIPKLLDGHLLHYSYYSHAQHRERADKYSRLTALKLYNKGKRVGPLKPYLSALGRFVAMYILKRGFLDGKAGFHIARISAASNIFKYKELRRLQHENH